MEIRKLDEERDAGAAVALLRKASPTAVVTVESWLHRGRTMPPRAALAGWVAVEDDRVVATAWAHRTFFSAGSTTAMAGVFVDSPYRRGGIGSALLDLVTQHVDSIGCDELLVSFTENDDGVRFAERHGFREIRAEREALLDLRTVDAAPPDDVDIRAVTDVDPRLAWIADVEATRDMPSTEQIDHVPYEDWGEHVLEYPLFAAAGSFVALVDGEPAAVSLLIADEASGRSMNMFTGTRQAFRGRGLGLAVKLASIRWAKEHGITQMATRNDETNAPMLAINRRLGFVPGERRVEWVRAGTASSRAQPAPAR